MTHPTDTLRLVQDEYVLVPREPTGAMLKAAFAAMNATPSGTWKRMKAEARHPIQIFNAKMRPRWSAMLSAAPAPPLPEGGGMTAGERAFTAWAGSSRADGTPLMWTWDEMPDEQRHRWNRIADAVLAPLPAAPTGDRL